MTLTYSSDINQNHAPVISGVTGKLWFRIIHGLIQSNGQVHPMVKATCEQACLIQTLSMGITQKRRNSIASAMELRLFCVNPIDICICTGMSFMKTQLSWHQIYTSPLQILVTKVVKTNFFMNVHFDSDDKELTTWLPTWMLDFHPISDK